MDSTKPTDEELIVRVARGEQGALEVLYDRYARIAFSLAWRMLGSRQVTEEVVQEVFLKVWQNASSYRPDRGSFAQWLLSICRHRAVDELRRGGRSLGRVSLEIDANVRDEEKDYVDGFVERQFIQEALEALSGDQKKVIMMAYFEGLTHSEIAQSLGLPLGTVKTRMRSGLQRLKARLEGMGVRDRGV